MSHLYRRTKYDVSEAERLFNLALELDNTLVPALCALSEVHYFQTFVRGNRPRWRFIAWRRRGSRIERSHLDNQDPGAYCALARANMMSGDHGTASSYAETALALNPSFGPGLVPTRNVASLTMGVRTKALPHIEVGDQAEPARSIRWSFYGGDCRGPRYFSANMRKR